MYNILIIVTLFSNIDNLKPIAVSTELTVTKYTYEECVKESNRISKRIEVSKYTIREISTECILTGIK